MVVRWAWILLVACGNRREEPPVMPPPPAIVVDARPTADAPSIDAGIEGTPFVHEVRGRANQDGIGRAFAAEGTTLLIGDGDDKSPEDHTGVYRIMSLASGSPVDEAWFSSDTINRFGAAVAIDHGTLVGLDNERLMVFEKPGDNWQRRDILTGRFWSAKPFLGLDGDTLVARSEEDVSIFTRTAGTWRRLATYVPKGVSFDVAMAGEIVAVAVHEPFELRVLRRGKLVESFEIPFSLDHGLAVSGERIAVGDRESVTIHQLPGGKVVGKISPTDDDRKRGQYSWASFGTSLLWRGPMLVIGGDRLGYVEIYCERAGAWQRSARITPPEPHPRFGTRLALAGNLLWVGSPPIYESRPFEGALRAYRVKPCD